ncbi:MAG: tetratricopeptide repeat protein [Spirochaetota bacterium]
MKNNPMKTILFLFLLFTFFSCKNGDKPEKAFGVLSQQHADKGKKKVEGQKSRQVRKLLQEGKTLNKQKKYQEAIGKFVEGLKLHPTAKLYYQYGNTLSNIKSYEKAKQAFILSISLDYPQKKYAYYNIACMASLLHQQDSSLKYLEKAIEAGYSNLGHIEKDSDLKWLRDNVLDFSSWLSKYKQLGSPAGRYYCFTQLGTGGEPAKHCKFFCGKEGSRSGKFIARVTPFGVNTTFTSGTWQWSGNNIRVHETRERFFKGIGEPLPESGPRTAVYASYKERDKRIDTVDEFSVTSIHAKGGDFSSGIVEDSGKFDGPCPSFASVTGTFKRENKILPP